MRRRVLLLSGLGALVAAGAVAIFLLPLSLALKLANAPIEGRASGRVWNGVIEDAQVEGAALGTVTLMPRALPLLTGRLDADATVAGPLGEGTGRGVLRDGVLMVETGGFALNLAALGARDAFGQPLQGVADIGVADLVIDASGCRAGIVAVSTDALREAARRFGGLIDAPVLTGEGVCEDGRLVLPLTGDGPDGRAAAVIRLQGRSYVTELILDPRDPRAGRALAAYGFQRTPEGYSLITRGAF